MKTIIYNRTSTEEQNPELQVKDCLSINNYGEYEIIQDKQSAWKDNVERQGFEQLKKRIQKGEVKHLIVWDFDRLFRNRKRFKEFLEFLKVYRVQLHSFRQNWFEQLHKIPEPWNEIVSELMINIYGHIAEDESKRKSDRVKNAVVQDQGITKSYKGNKWGRKPLPRSVIQEVLSKYEQGKSIRTISKEVTYWNHNNNKKNLSVGSVHKIIKENATEQV